MGELTKITSDNNPRKYVTYNLVGYSYNCKYAPDTQRFGTDYEGYANIAEGVLFYDFAVMGQTPDGLTEARGSTSSLGRRKRTAGLSATRCASSPEEAQARIAACKRYGPGHCGDSGHLQPTLGDRAAGQADEAEFPVEILLRESANAIKIQIWVTLIANLLPLVMQ